LDGLDDLDDLETSVTMAVSVAADESCSIAGLASMGDYSSEGG
jgi:hypothetical protein